MRILQINTIDRKGGAAKVAWLLKEEFERRGYYAPFFVGTKHSDNPNVFLIKKPNKILATLSKLAGRNLESTLKRKIPFWLSNDVDLFLSSKKLLKTDQFKESDIIHCHNLHSNFFKLLNLVNITKQKPTVWTLHDMWSITAHCAYAYEGQVNNRGFFQCPSMDIYPPISWHNENYLEKRKRSIYEKSKFHIVVPSKWLANKVKQSILNKHPLTVIYNGIDTSIFKPHPRDQVRRELGLPLDKKIIIFVAKGGKNHPRKGVGYFESVIESFKNRGDLVFLNIGGDTNHAHKDVVNVSYVAEDLRLAQYYSAADMLIYPSLADNCPLVILESMACGLPIVSFDTGGIPELVEHKINGYVAKYKDANDLKTGVGYLLSLSPRETERMGQYSVNKIKTGFTVEKMTDKYIELYKNLIASRR